MNNYYEGFLLGEWQVYPETGVLSRNGLRIRAEPKVIDLLMALIHSPEQFGSREQLLAKVWPDVVVNEEVLTRAVSELRTLLGDTSRNRRYILTVPKRGYKLLLTPTTLCKPPSQPSDNSRPMFAQWSRWIMLGKLAHHIAVFAGYVFLGAGSWLYWADSRDHHATPALDSGAIAQSPYNCDPSDSATLSSKFKAA
ncbi:winged helix-turn-helix domain-containing protein [Pseudohongiella spirulinae]|uniref:OmpR/PhoB-type domain-containing protein n=1 Tax=Pseudohongiella spirulinae TaxID=1249552 RepID=A0A0S2KCB9_9GAMM|nr:transcriptional regulator [Pseudohongiella spirulinae]ALO45958.1 hypothetical protein PS2015_1300 [Pseudohongiella spirulinae]